MRENIEEKLVQEGKSGDERQYTVGMICGTNEF